MAGVLLEPEGPGTVGYVGIEIEGQADDLARAHAMQSAWLASLTADTGLSVEARYVVSPPSPIRLVLLGRVAATSEPAALAAAESALECLAAVPGVTARRLADPADIAAVLRPFQPHPQGMIEIRKQVVVAQPHRPDAGVRAYALVKPFAVEPSSRALLSDAFDRAAVPLVFGVGVRPMPRPSWLTPFLAENAAAYARLAQPAMWRPPGSVHQPLRHLSPEPFAVTAATHYQRTVERLGGWLGRVRVHLSSPAPVTDVVAHCAGRALGEHVVVRPSTAAARTAFEQALGTLEHLSWATDADALGEPFRVLSLAADPEEAAAALGVSEWGRGGTARNDRDRALDILVAVGRAMERATPTYGNADEETLRDHLVTALNGAFAGSVFAEARNGAGRTDILIRIADRTLLVVECKIWNGPKRLHDAIDQLLRYLTRRDASAALVTFLRGGVADVMDRADVVVRGHSAFLRAVSSDGDSRSDYVLRRDDGGEVPFTFLPVG